MKIRKVPLCEERELKRTDRELSKSLLVTTGTIAQVRNQREIIIPYQSSVLIFQGGYVRGNSYPEVKRKIEYQGLLMAAAPHALTLFRYLIAEQNQELRKEYFYPMRTFDEKAICFDTVLNGHEFNQEVIDNPRTKIENNRGRIGYHEERIRQVLGLSDGTKVLEDLRKAKEFSPLKIYSYDLLTNNPYNEFDGKDGDFLLLRPCVDHAFAELQLRFANGRDYITHNCNGYYALTMLDPSKNKQYFKAAYRGLVNQVLDQRKQEKTRLQTEIAKNEKRIKQLDDLKI
jgi:hypothetical protein